MTRCQHCHNSIRAIGVREHVDLAGEAFCGNGVQRHEPENLTVVTRSPSLGWLQTTPYVDQWGRTGS